MTPEIEAAFVNIDKDAYRKKLRSAGAILVQPEILMKRVIFYTDENSFIRVRDEGNKITLSYKRLDELSLSGMQEICLEVNDYDKAVEFVKACGFTPKAQQETYREEWKLDGTEITIDTWPWLPPYTEIEGPSEEIVKAVAAKLGFEMENAQYGSSSEIYQLYYDVTAHEINNYPEIKFTDIPKWLADKRRTDAKI